MRITRYLAGQILTAMVFIVVSLTCVIWLSQSLRFVELIVNRGLPVLSFVYLTFLLLPTWLSIILPISVFAATVFVYNRLTTDREMVVMSAAGMSPLRLAVPALVVAAGTAVVGYAMTLYLVPMSYRSFKELQFQIRHNFDQLVLREGEFRSIGDGLTVYVRTREEHGQLAGIVVHDQRDSSRTVTLVAERGALVATPDGPRVIMANGSRQERDTGTGRVNVLYFERYTVDIGAMREVAQRTIRDQNELFLGDLLYPTAEVTDPRNFNEYVAEGHQRLTSPLLAFSLTAIALAVLLSGEFSRRGQTARITVAVLVAAAAEAAGLGSKFLAVRDPVLIPVMWLAVIGPFAIALLMLTRSRLRRPQPAAGPAPV